jgi:hypothetical protein
MDKLAYTIASLNRRAQLASMVKSAKFSWEMTDEEKARAADYTRRIQESTPTRTTASPNSWWNQAKGAAYSTAANGGIGLIRAGQAGIDTLWYLPRIADQCFNGNVLKIDRGQGLFGRANAWLNRKVDQAVTWLAKKPEIYNYEHNLDNTWVSGYNRKLRTGADVVGSIVGYLNPKALFNPKKAVTGILNSKPSWNGVGRFMKNNWLNALMTGNYAKQELLNPNGVQAQLRANEDYMRTLPVSSWRTYDTTSTPANIMGAPTSYEYRHYLMPQYPPATPTGNYTWEYGQPYHNGRPIPGAPPENTSDDTTKK